jgi:hypothetical protein
MACFIIKKIKNRSRGGGGVGGGGREKKMKKQIKANVSYDS